MKCLEIDKPEAVLIDGDPAAGRTSTEVHYASTVDLPSSMSADEGLIAEAKADGTITKTYGWNPGGLWGTNPVWMDVINSTVETNGYHWFENDHLGSPQKMTAPNGAVTWSATYDAFGKATLDPASTVINNHRFPGQIFDEETGNHYNLRRYFDPTAGRYITNDPIGFAGGNVNLYGYAFNNPKKYFDPTGLDSASDVMKDWFFERGANDRVYGPEHEITQDLMRDTGVKEAREAWDKKGRPAHFEYQYGFGPGDYLRELLTFDDTGSFLGSYRVIIDSACGKNDFEVKNTTGWESGTRSPIPSASKNPSIEDMIRGGPFTMNPRSILNNRERGQYGPGGNFRQSYTWRE